LTNVLQPEQLTIGDFNGAWLKCKLEMSKFGSTFAKNLLKQMKKRFGVLFKSEVVLANLYPDPRYSYYFIFAVRFYNNPPSTIFFFV
jgi:hypothetical protein